MAGRGQRGAAAFSDFVAARSTSLFRTAYRMMGDYQLAQDLMQESLVKAYVAWPRLRDVTKAEAYTRRIIVTTSISWRRRRAFHEYPTASRLDSASPDQTEQLGRKRSCGLSYSCFRRGSVQRWCCDSARTCPRRRPPS
jgi:DNA-directed RNA polymerase specialized sigma24 family protein